MKSLNAQRLGQSLQTWDDLLSEHATSRQKLAEAFKARLLAREIPNLTVNEGEIFIGSIGALRRDYTFVTHKDGAYMTVAFREYGKDLLIAWNLWWRPKYNLLLIGICLLLTLFWGLGILVAVIIAFAGQVMRGRWSAFFVTDLDMFTLEDVKAMTMAVDFSLREATDVIGIKLQLRERPAPVGSKRSRVI